MLLPRFLHVFGFQQFDIMCLGVDHIQFVKFITLGVCLASWMWRFISSIKFGSFQPLFLEILFLLSFSSPSGTHVMHMLSHLMVSHVSEAVCYSVLLFVFYLFYVLFSFFPFFWINCTFLKFGFVSIFAVFSLLFFSGCFSVSNMHL